MHHRAQLDCDSAHGLRPRLVQHLSQPTSSSTPALFWRLCRQDPGVRLPLHVHVAYPQPACQGAADSLCRRRCSSTSQCCQRTTTPCLPDPILHARSTDVTNFSWQGDGDGRPRRRVAFQGCLHVLWGLVCEAPSRPRHDSHHGPFVPRCVSSLRRGRPRPHGHAPTRLSLPPAQLPPARLSRRMSASRSHPRRRRARTP